jgi:hypothetical protein
MSFGKANLIFSKHGREKKTFTKKSSEMKGVTMAEGANCRVESHAWLPRTWKRTKTFTKKKYRERT